MLSIITHSCGIIHVHGNSRANKLIELSNAIFGLIAMDAKLTNDNNDSFHFTYGTPATL